MFLLVPAHPGSPGQRAVKRLCVGGGGQAPSMLACIPSTKYKTTAAASAAAATTTPTHTHTYHFTTLLDFVQDR